MDELWTPQLIISAREIYVCDYYFYYHYMRDGSIMHSSNLTKSGQSLLEISRDLSCIYGTNKHYKYFRDRMASFYLQAAYKIPEQINEFDRSFPIRNSFYFKTRVKGLIFLLSPMIYLLLHKAIKRPSLLKTRNWVKQPRQ